MTQFQLRKWTGEQHTPHKITVVCTSVFDENDQIVFSSILDTARFFQASVTTIERYFEKEEPYDGYLITLEGSRRQTRPPEPEHTYCQSCGKEDKDEVKICFECYESFLKWKRRRDNNG